MQETIHASAAFRAACETALTETHKLQEVVRTFNDALREEQVRRSAHFSCLPLDIKLHVLTYLGNASSTPHMFRRVCGNFCLFTPVELAEVRTAMRGEMSFYWHVQDLSCRMSLKHFESSQDPIAILASDNTSAPPAPWVGTSRGRYIVALLSSPSPFWLSSEIDHLRLRGNAIHLTVNRVALVCKHPENPFQGVDESVDEGADPEEYVGFETSHALRKIWWVDSHNLQSMVYFPSSKQHYHILF